MPNEVGKPKRTQNELGPASRCLSTTKKIYLRFHRRDSNSCVGQDGHFPQLSTSDGKRELEKGSDSNGVFTQTQF